MNSKNFFSKILLFGEYSIIYNSKALTLPFSLFSGMLSFPDQRSGRSLAQDSNAELKNFSAYLDELSRDQLQGILDVSSFKFDLEQGLYFNSTIPQGYGVGSSGALCAAIFYRYKTNEISNTKKLKRIFSLMEGYFHGSSSGIDPLIIYKGEPILHSCNDGVEEIDVSKGKKGRGALFLVNTKRARRTEPLVNLFLEKCKNEDFEYFFKNEYLKINNYCVDDFMKGEMEELFKNFKTLSTYQLEHFLPMIPKLLQRSWKNGLEDDLYYLKLCGAGGGGFFLGMTKNFEKTKEALNSNELRAIYYF